jgi:hypothetical protein
LPGLPYGSPIESADLWALAKLYLCVCEEPVQPYVFFSYCYTLRRGGRGNDQEMAAFTSSMTLFSAMGLHFLSAYETGQMSPSSRFAASWKPRVE